MYLQQRSLYLQRILLRCWRTFIYWINRHSSWCTGNALQLAMKLWKTAGDNLQLSAKHFHCSCSPFNRAVWPGSRSAAQTSTVGNYQSDIHSSILLNLLRSFRVQAIAQFQPAQGKTVRDPMTIMEPTTGKLETGPTVITVFNVFKLLILLASRAFPKPDNNRLQIPSGLWKKRLQTIWGA